jgi:hypothetical protein
MGVRRSRGLVLVAYLEITFKWSQKDLLARHTASFGSAHTCGAVGDSASKVRFLEIILPNMQPCESKRVLSNEAKATDFPQTLCKRH